MKPKNEAMGENIALRIVVEGDIQGVGYRALVKNIARKLKIAGFVKNLPDGSVEIFCEGAKKNVEMFKGKINIKTEDGGPFTVNVENIKEFAIERLPVKTETFEIDYGSEAKTDFEKTNLERLEIGSLILSDFRNNTNQNFNELNSKSDKLDSTMNGFKKETNQNFVTMGDKYGDISNQMLKVEANISKLIEEFADSNKNNAELVKTLINKLDKVIK